MAYQVLLVGQDITNYVDQMSIVVEDTLGQGSGAGTSSAPQGRATTCSFTTTLGPMNTAYGAGQTLPNSGGPFLVRQGELIITDANGLRIFGGYATKYNDVSQILGPTKRATAVDAIDYSTSLQRVVVDEIFSAQTDVQIIQYVINKYAPWISLQYLQTNGNYTFTAKSFRQVSVEQVLQTIAGVTGFLVWVDYYKNLHYISPAQASSGPFNVSDNPDFLHTFPHRVDEFLTDDNSAINRVTFYGGTMQSGDIKQDVSPLCNGSNTIFVFAAYPIPNSSGAIQVLLNGVFQTVGTMNGTGAANQFISNGGTAQVLIDTNGPNATFDPASPPAAGSTLFLLYRYNFPLSVRINDQKSYNFFGPPWLDGTMQDSTVYDTQTAVQRCKVLLMQQSFGLVTLKFRVWKGGLQSGQTIQVTNLNRGINGVTYLIQEVRTSPLGGGNFAYDITCGAWNWNVVDVLVKMASMINPPDLQNNEAVIAVILEQGLFNVSIVDSWSKSEHTHGGYYARSAPVGDGHDAYPGFFTITS